MRKERCHAEDRRAEARPGRERGVIIRTRRGGAACQSTPPYAAHSPPQHRRARRRDVYLYRFRRDRERGKSAAPREEQKHQRLRARLLRAAADDRPSRRAPRGDRRGPGGTVRGAGARPLRRAAHPARARRMRRAETARCRALLGNGRAERALERPVRRGRRGHVFRRQAQHRHEGRPPPLYFRGVRRVRRERGHPHRCQAAHRHRPALHRFAESAAGAAFPRRGGALQPSGHRTGAEGRTARRAAGHVSRRNVYAPRGARGARGRSQRARHLRHAARRGHPDGAEALCRGCAHRAPPE